MAYFGGGIFCSSSSVWGESHSLSHQNSNCAAWASLACLYSFRINKPQTNLASILNYWGMPTKECHWKQTEAHGTSWYKGPSVPSLLLLADKGFSLLGFLWVPKSRVKQLLIREVRGCRNKGKVVKKREFNNKTEAPSSSSRDILNNMTCTLELFCRN